MKSYKNILILLISGEISLFIFSSTIHQVSNFFFDKDIHLVVNQISSPVLGIYRFIGLVILLVLIITTNFQTFKFAKLPIGFIFIFILIIQPVFLPKDFLLLNLSGAIKFLYYALLCAFLIREVNITHEISNVDIPKVIFILFYIVLFVNVIYFILHTSEVIHDFTHFDYIEKRGFILGAGNEEGNFMMTILPFILLKYKKISIKTILLFFLILLLLMVNGSRASLGIFVVTTSVYYLLSSEKKVLTFSVIILIGILISSFLYSTIYFRYEKVFQSFNYYSIFNSTGNTGSDNFSFRVFALWLPAILFTMKYNLLLGIGPSAPNILDNYNILIVPMDEKYGASLHNTFVYIFSCFGLIGLILFFILLTGLLLKCFNAILKFKNEKGFPAIFASLTGFFIWSNISNSNTTIGWNYLILVIFYFFILKIKNVNQTTIDKNEDANKLAYVIQ